MTLQEKLKKEGFSNCDYLEQVADDYAIEFGKWLNNQVLKKKGSHYHLHNKMRVSELYIIYKKEKGL